MFIKIVHQKLEIFTFSKYKDEADFDDVLNVSLRYVDVSLTVFLIWYHFCKFNSNSATLSENPIPLDKFENFIIISEHFDQGQGS